MNNRQLREIYLVRHGDADKVDSDGSSIPDDLRSLSAQGIAEVHALANQLNELGVQPNIILSSFLTRVVQTAEIIAAKLGNPPIQKSELIGEVNLGNLRSSKKALQNADYGYNRQIVLKAGGETIDEVEKRVSRFLEELEETSYACAIIASHGLILSVLAQLILELERTFENIQALDTADYSYFKISKSGDRTEILKQENNVLKGKPF